MASGHGFAGGYGFVPRVAYATPAELDFKPWATDFLTTGGIPAYPTDAWLNPYATTPPLQWQPGDWDPGLRWWSLPEIDWHLTEWLQDTDLGSPAVQAAREFAAQHARWSCHDDDLLVQARRLLAGPNGTPWLTADDLKWLPGVAGHDTTSAKAAVRLELDELVQHMEDTRARYLDESLLQSDGLTRYVMHVLGADSLSRPWTATLVRSAVAIANVAYMYWKGRFRRVRPSTLCPGLAVPFGPPRHPSFPSGHATTAHLVVLCLLGVPGIARRFGVGMNRDGAAGHAPATLVDFTDGPLFWLADRLATNRERLGVHYRSDSSAGRRLAGGLWEAWQTPGAAKPLVLPTLDRTQRLAAAEWA